ncbi:MAG: homocysteine S-methyltransferase family protein [Planctomycetota bacterium]
MELLELLESRPLVVGDGAMGTRLIQQGMEPGTCGELWNLESRGSVEQILHGYVEAGADFVITNTFGANGVNCRRHGLEEMTGRINRAGVRVAREAAGDSALVLGGLGPTGGMLEPFGDLTEEQVREAYRAQLDGLLDEGVDGIICETFEAAAELRQALITARELSDLPVLASMKFTRAKNGEYRTMMGEGPEALAEAAAECDCAAAGTNCVDGIAEAVQLTEKLAELLDVPVLVEPNAGTPQLHGAETHYPEGPDVFERHLPDLYQAGARVIGGCCGTTAEHIRAIRRYADSLEG